MARTPHDAGLHLRAMTPVALAAALAQHGVAAELGECRRIVSAVHRGRTLEELRAGMAGVRRGTMTAARAYGALPELTVVARQSSAIDPFLKLLFQAADGERFEAVRIPLEKPGRFSACVSSQVGCAMACAFCATGRLGLRRNLATWEIVDQVRHIVASLQPETEARSEVPPRTPRPPVRVHGVVFQGMGEPMANLDRVLDAIAVLTDPSAMAIDARAITVCTVGMPSGIRRLARDAPKVRLGLSLGSGVRARRRHLMPIDDVHALDDVLAAAVDHARVTGMAPMWAITLLAGVNDAVEDAEALGERAADFARCAGVRPRLSIIPYNSIGTPEPFTRSDAAAEARYREVLHAMGQGTHRRYSGGADVGAACGQLAACEAVGIR